MRRALPVFAALALAVGATNVVRAQLPAPPPVPDISGSWYMNGDPNQRCQISQPQLDGNALFTNEHGSSAWGTVRGDRVFIPEWNEGRGEVGTIRGNRIVWPNGTYWARYGY
jgi:hypothetical protein